MAGRVGIWASTSPLPFLSLPPPHTISQPRPGSFHCQCGWGREADGCCWLMGAAEREGAEWSPRPVAAWPQDPGSSPCPGPRCGRKGHLSPRAGAGCQSVRPGKPGPKGWAGPALPPAGGSRPRCRGRATRQGSVLGLRPRVSLLTQSWP